MNSWCSKKNFIALSRALSLVSRVFIVSIIAVALIIIGVTLYSLASRSKPGGNQSNKLPNSAGEHIFTGIGQLRIPTADKEPAVLILFISFVYNPDDKAFSEELALRIGDFRSIIQAFISSCSILELRKMGDEGLKTELLRRFNSILRLGKIDTLFLTDFMIIG
jgi:flagellar basal body-associated protein FliL